MIFLSPVDAGIHGPDRLGCTPPLTVGLPFQVIKVPQVGSEGRKSGTSSYALYMHPGHSSQPIELFSSATPTGLDRSTGRCYDGKTGQHLDYLGLLEESHITWESHITRGARPHAGQSHGKVVWMTDACHCIWLVMEGHETCIDKPGD